MSTITVHYFDCYDIATDESVRSKRLATVEAIHNIGGVLVSGTAQEVDASCIDDEGFLRDPYFKGLETGTAMADAINQFLDLRLPEMSVRMLDALRQRLSTIWEDPRHEPKHLAFIEWKIFEEHLDTLPARIREEVAQALAPWLELANTTGVRGLTDELINNRITHAFTDLRVSALAQVNNIAKHLP
jgi:hypothetical protein